MRSLDLAAPFENGLRAFRLDGLVGLGQCAMLAAFFLCVFGIALSAAAVAREDRRFVRAARRGMYAIFALLLVASVSLVSAFVRGIYNVRYVYEYSERAQVLPFKIAGLWAGLDGSLLFWSLLLGTFAAIVARQGHREEPPARVRLEPYLHAIFCLVLGFFLFVTNFLANPFRLIDDQALQNLVAQGRAQVGPGGIVADGQGLNPLLNNYWMIIHPPSLYLGFTGFTVPFAFAAASLMSGELGLYWIRATRRWTMVAWCFLTNGVILGGLWAYEVLGWGGYWAWDPVENASFMPWLTATAFLHTVMVVERRNMLQRWNMLLILLTFFLTLFGTYLTRSGVVASVHAFSASDLGDYFFGFLLFILVGGTSLIVLRNRELSSEYRFEAVASREVAFLFNNLILVCLSLSILLLTVWPTVSYRLFGRELSVGPPTFSLVTTPLFAVLILLTAIGPAFGWVKTTPKLLKRNLGIPLVVALVVVSGALLLWHVRDEPVTLYPPILVGFASFAMGSAIGDFVRGVRARRHSRGEGVVQALARLSVANNRRYGGYVVHLGFGLIVFGIVGSAFFREKKDATLVVGDRVTLDRGGYTLHYAGTREGDTGVYSWSAEHFELFRGQRKVADLHPEKRFYKKKEQDTTEVAIRRSLLGDVYVFFAGRDPSGKGNLFTIFHNPLINWIWIGWLVTIAGGVFAALPMGKRRVGLAE